MKTQNRSSRQMLTRWMMATLTIAVFAVGSDVRAGTEASVDEANAQFYAALNAMFVGDVAPMKEIWSRRDDVTYMGPDGRVDIGWAPVFANWEKQAAKKLGGRVESTRIHANVGSDLAVVTTVEVGENTNAAGKPEKVSIRATNVFRKEDGTWKMIGHHTDVLPFLEEPTQVGSAR